MTDFRQYEITADPMWAISLAMGDCGYDAMDRARPEGWRPIPVWGPDGRDLGEWDLVVVFCRTKGRKYEVAMRVEGDVTVWAFSDLPTRDALIDSLHAEWNPPKHNQVWDSERGAWQCPTCDSASDDCVLA